MANVHSAFRPLRGLIGTWKVQGRTLRATADDVSGRITIQPILDGAYLELRGHQIFTGLQLDISYLEIIRIGAAKKTYPSDVYLTKGGGAGAAAMRFEWIVEDNGTVVHRGGGATYRGTFSPDGTALQGGVRPDSSADESMDTAYDVVLTRVS
jgi:hypothetical protein